LRASFYFCSGFMPLTTNVVLPLLMLLLPLSLLLLVSTSWNGVLAQGGGGGGTTTGVACPTTTASAAQSPVKFDFTTVSSRVTISTTQCPPYDSSSQTTGNAPLKECLTYSYNYPPVFNAIANKINLGVYYDVAQTSSNPNPQGGAIGVSINGVAVYSNTDGEKRDAFVYEGETFDTCAGHASPDGIYHYHAEPTAGCVFTTAASTHSPLFAVMADGFGLYGQYGDNGTIPTDLDECSGHSDVSNPFYHYHLPYPYQTYPYILNCLRGCIATDALEPPTVPVCQPATNPHGTNYTLFRAALEKVSTSAYTCSDVASSGSSSLSSTGMSRPGSSGGPRPPSSGAPPAQSTGVNENGVTARSTTSFVIVLAAIVLTTLALANPAAE